MQKVSPKSHLHSSKYRPYVRYLNPARDSLVFQTFPGFGCLFASQIWRMLLSKVTYMQERLRPNPSHPN